MFKTSTFSIPFWKFSSKLAPEKLPGTPIGKCSFPSTIFQGRLPPKAQPGGSCGAICLQCGYPEKMGRRWQDFLVIHIK